ncbi:MAG: outer membrane protein transport protein [Myxococcales bacterium]|nr:outer membrane protein transport protein [Myxococcales bacterium]
MRRLALTLAATALAGPAHANLFDVFGAGARSQAMAGAVAALAGDAMAAFHNPAGLTESPSAFIVGVTGLFNRTSILLTPRPLGYDPKGYGANPSARADTVEPPGTAGALLGLSAHPFSEDLAVGVAAFVPFEGFASLNTHFADEREQAFSNRLHYELLGERLESEVITFALAWRLRSWLSMGLGLMILPGAKVTAPVYARSATDLTQVDINARVGTEFSRALTAGLQVQPFEQLRVGVAFQDEVRTRIHGRSEVQVRGDEEQGVVFQELDLVTAFSPLRATLGVAWVAEGGFTASLEGTYRAWSRYTDNHNESGGFDDTVDAKAALEWPVGERTFARAGVSFTPSPVPAQTGRTSYVDNDRVGFGFGAGRDLQVFGQDLTLDIAFQVQALLTEETRKARGAYPDCAPGVRALCDESPDLAEDTPLLSAAETRGLQTGSPGFPGYTHGGYLVAASVDLRWRF